MGHPRSLAMSPFNRAHTTFYSSLIETMPLSCTYRFRDITSYLPKFANFDLPHLLCAPLLGMTLIELPQDLWHQKTRVPGLLQGHRLHVPMFIHFTRTPTCDKHNKHGHRQTQDHIIYCAKQLA